MTLEKVLMRRVKLITSFIYMPKNIWFIMLLASSVIDCLGQLVRYRVNSALIDCTLPQNQPIFMPKTLIYRYLCTAELMSWSTRTRATEILKSKSVHSTDDIIDVIRTRVRQSQIVTKTLHFHPIVYQKLVIFLIQSNSNLL